MTWPGRARPGQRIIGALLCPTLLCCVPAAPGQAQDVWRKRTSCAASCHGHGHQAAVLVQAVDGWMVVVVTKQDGLKYIGTPKVTNYYK